MKPVVIVREPFGRPGPPDFHLRNVGERLGEVLMELSPSRWGGLHVDVYRGNYRPECFVPLEACKDMVLSEDDRIIVDVLPAGFAAIGGIASNFFVSAAVGFGLSFLSQALAPTPWVGPGAAARTRPTPLNQLDPPRNTSRLGSRIPDLYGLMRTWPDLIYPPYEEWTNLANDGNPGRVQTLQSVYCVSEGDCDLTMPYVGDTPLEAIEGAVMTILKPGDPLPSAFQLVQSNSIAADITLLMPQQWPDPAEGDINGWVDGEAGYTPWFRLPQGDVIQVWSQLSFPQGALSSEFKYGQSGPYNHRLTIQYRRIDPLTAAILEGPITEPASFWNKTTSPIRLTRKSQTLTAGLWEVRYRREDNALRRDEDLASGIDQFNRGVVLVETQGYSVLEAEQRLNDTTRVHLQFTNLSASAQVSVNAQSRFNIEATRRLPIVNLSTAQIDPEAPTVRWIDAMYHMLVNPLIGNYSPAEIDLDSLIRVQKTMESRTLITDLYSGEYNALWDAVLSVDEQVSTTARAARAALYSDGAQIIAAVDADNRFDEDYNPRNPWEIVTAMFNRRNRRAQDVDAGVSMRAALPTENDGVEINWIDRDSNWQKRTLIYTPSGSATALRPIRVEAIGLTSFEQVWRHSQYLFNRNLFRRKTTTVNAFEEIALLSLYDTVQVVQPWREIQTDGQIVQYVDASPVHWVTLDQDVSGITAFTDTIRIRSTDGETTEIFDITDVDPALNRVRLGPRSGADPQIAIQAGIPTTQMGNLFEVSTDANDGADQWLVLASNAQTYEGTVTLTNSDNRVFMGDQIELGADPGLPHTPPRTPPTPGQHPCLAFWYYPEVDANLTVRRTRFQESFDLIFSTSGLGDNFDEVGRGFRSRPAETSAGYDRDSLEITASTVEREHWNWWLGPPPGGSQLQRGIFYWHIELVDDPTILEQPNARFLWSFRQFNTEWYGLRLMQDLVSAGSEMEFARGNGTASGSQVSSVVDNVIGTEYIVAATFDASSSDQYSYVGQPLISPGTSVRRGGGSQSLPNLGGGLNMYIAGGWQGSNSVRGTFYLREFRCYNCIPNEQFVADLAAGLRSESPL